MKPLRTRQTLFGFHSPLTHMEPDRRILVTLFRHLVACNTRAEESSTHTHTLVPLFGFRVPRSAIPFITALVVPFCVN